MVLRSCALGNEGKEERKKGGGGWLTYGEGGDGDPLCRSENKYRSAAAGGILLQFFNLVFQTNMFKVSETRPFL